MTAALVVFTADDRMLRRMDVATGPCMSISGRALVGPGRQLHGDTVAELTALYWALAGRTDDGALEPVGFAGRGELHRLRPDFAEAVASLVNDKDYESRERQFLDPVAQRWQATHRWQRGMQRGGLIMRLNDWGLTVAEGIRLGREAYCWRGPAVEMYEVHPSSG